jgi:AhpD family alkylhydroperoxidase
MTARLDYSTAAPEAMRPLYEIVKLLNDSTLEPALRTLVEIRASQMNGCAFCLALHMREAEALGERGDRISGLPAWREASWYSDRERAALELTEVLTHLSGHVVPDDVFARVKAQFNDREIVLLIMGISLINTWNRLNLTFRTPPELADAVFARLHPQHEAAATA